MLRRLVLLVAIVPLFAAVPAPPAPPAPRAPASPMDALNDVAQDLKFDQTLTLLAAGADPKAVVRYKPKPGATSSYETVVRTTMDMSMTMPGGETMAMPMGGAMPAVVMGVRNTVGQPVANGLVPVRIEQLGARLEGAAAPEVAQGMQAGLAGLDGMVFEMLVDADGKPVQLDVVGGSDPAMADFVQQLADQTASRMPIFPDEPIGTGARWTTNTDLSMSGLQMVVTQTVTARAITADGVDLDLVMTLALGEGGFSLPGLPPGAAEMTKFAGTGKGRMHVDLGTLVSTGTTAMDIDVAMKMSVPGQPPMAMTMKMQQATEMRPAK